MNEIKKDILLEAGNETKEMKNQLEEKLDIEDDGIAIPKSHPMIKGDTVIINSSDDDDNSAIKSIDSEKSLQVDEWRTKSNTGPFENLWPGMKRCTICGFAFATFDSEEKEYNSKKGRMVPKYPNERPLHATYHGKFNKCLEVYSKNKKQILYYSELREALKNMPKTLKSLEEQDFKDGMLKIRETLGKVVGVIRYIYEITNRIPNFSVNKELPNLLSCMDLAEKLEAFYREPEIEGAVKMYFEFGKSDEKEVDAVENIYAIKEDSDNIKHNNGPIDLLYSLSDELKLVVDKYSEFDEIDSLKKFNEALSLLLNEYSDETCIVSPKITNSEFIMRTIFVIEYTRSQRLWDMCKAHPYFEDYCKILWSTPKFVKFMTPHLSDLALLYFTEKNKCNRKLVDFKFDDAPFYFGNVMESDYCYECRKKDEVCQGCESFESVKFCYKCKRCKCKNCGVTDVTYVDTLRSIEDDEVGTDEVIDEKTHDAMMDSVGKVFNSKLK